MSLAEREAAFLALVERRRLQPPADRFLERGLRRAQRFLARGALRDRTAARRSPLRGLDPRARLLGVLGCLVSLSLAASLPALLAHATIPAALLALSRIRLRETLAAGLLAAAVFTLLMAAPATLNLVHDGEIVLPLAAPAGAGRLGPIALPPIVGVTREGLATAATLLIRVLVSTSTVLWLTLSTPWADLLRALRAVGVPAIAVQVAGMTVRYLHVLLRASYDAQLGKRSRAVCRRPLAAEQAWAGHRIALLWGRSEQLMQEVGDAMTARGFSGQAVLPPGSRFGAREWLFLLCIAAACAATRLA